MAFQQPIQRPSRRAPTPPPIATSSQTPKKFESVEESQEWVLFSPPPPRDEQIDKNLDATVQTPIPITPRTFPKSRLSDFGSLDTAAVSERHRNSEPTEEEQEDDDDDDADSLDDGLHAFNEPTSISNPSAHQCLDSSIADPVLPAHDGLGGFAGSSQPVQEHHWQHEKYNPRRVARRSSSLHRSSVQRRLDLLNQEQNRDAPRDVTEERNRRIERWRLEQSRAIVEEIERETRRRRRRSRLSKSSLSPTNFNNEEEKENIAPEAIATDESQTGPIDSEGFWARARRVICDLIDVDDLTLSYLFGESLPEAEESHEHATHHKPISSQMIEHAERTVPDSLELIKNSNSWQDNLLARIAHELGALVHRLSEHPPDAFSTYVKVQETVPYAGIPTPSEIVTPAGFIRFELPPTTTVRRFESRHRHRKRFSSTRTDPSLFGIEEEAVVDGFIEEDNQLTPQPTRASIPLVEDELNRLRSERDYWEKDLDVKMVFGFLRRRLGRQNSHTTPDAPATSSRLSDHATGPSFSSRGNSTGPDTLRRAALIRHHHPLVSRNLNTLRASAQSQFTSQPAQLPTTPLSPILGRRNSSVMDDTASSCASQSTKKSKTHHSGSLSMNSSRNYWDIGGPSWGEV